MGEFQKGRLLLTIQRTFLPPLTPSPSGETVDFPSPGRPRCRLQNCTKEALW